MPDDASAHRLADDETNDRRVSPKIWAVMDHNRTTTRTGTRPDNGRELASASHSVCLRQHDAEVLSAISTEIDSGRELFAALTAASGEDAAAGAGAHTQPEAVLLGATAVVRLVGALAHGGTPSARKSRNIG
jgi:hypothetical protein